MYRVGFVSNSSSCSFMIGYRGTKEDLIASTGVLSGFMRRLLEKAEHLSDGWVNGSDEAIAARYKSWYGDEIPEYAEEENEWFIQRAKELFPGDGWTIAAGDASYNEGDDMETVIGNWQSNITGDTFVLETWM